MWKITKVNKEYIFNTYTGEPDDYCYTIVITKVDKPFKIKIKKISKDVFSEQEYYIGRIFRKGLL